MSEQSLHNFMDLPPSVDLSDALGEIYLYKDALTDEQVIELYGCIQDRLPESVEYTAEFDLQAEVTSQLQAVKALRAQVIDSQGMVRAGVSPKDLKEVVTASNTLLTTLMKTHEKVMNFDRQRAMEQACIETIKTLPEETQTQFFERLESRLNAIE